ncbi:MAG: YbaK/EbsC family protein [Gaiellales bacterium]
MGTWPADVERVAAFLRAAGADGRIEEVAAEAATAAAAADAIGSTLGQIVKSLALLADEAPLVALVPGDRRIDTGKVAALVGARRVRIADAETVVELTGFAPGGVAPFPLPQIPVILLERRLLRHVTVWAGAGSATHLVRLDPLELVRLTQARVEDIVLESA